ncbi:hypothetical protein CPB86DRAFT_782992 [Serendipita vermifera]|nr:hypothetical protein CPB86DRAFT_782992 [Serendipita vermifera]
MASDLLALFASYTRSQYVQVAFQTWVVHETTHVELFWMRPWSWSKILFLINRYAAIWTVSLYTLQQFMKDASTKFCHVVLWLGFIGSAILISVLNLAILSRVVALWSHSRLIKSIATFLSLVNILAFIIASSYGWGTASVVPQMSPFTGCSAVSHADLKINLLLIPAFAFDTSALVLTLVKVHPMIKQAGVRLPILTLLLSDGIAYYIVIIISQALSFVATYPKNSSIVLPIVVANAVACNRLFIRLQEVLVQSDIFVLGETTGGNISARVWAETTRGIGGDILFAPIAHNESGVADPGPGDFCFIPNPLGVK